MRRRTNAWLVALLSSAIACKSASFRASEESASVVEKEIDFLRENASGSVCRSAEMLVNAWPTPLIAQVPPVPEGHPSCAPFERYVGDLGTGEADSDNFAAFEFCHREVVSKAECELRDWAVRFQREYDRPESAREVGNRIFSAAVPPGALKFYESESWGEAAATEHQWRGVDYQLDFDTKPLRFGSVRVELFPSDESPQKWLLWVVVREENWDVPE